MRATPAAPLARRRVRWRRPRPLRVRPDADLTGTRLIDSGQITDADRISTIGLEGAWVQRPVQGAGRVHGHQRQPRHARRLQPATAGTSRRLEPHRRDLGLQGRRHRAPGLPNEPASGMWQLGLRYDHADLNDGSVSPPRPPVVTGVLGGEESNWTVGVNWYWRSNFKFSALNYVWTSAASATAAARSCSCRTIRASSKCAPRSTGKAWLYERYLL